MILSRADGSGWSSAYAMDRLRHFGDVVAVPRPIGEVQPFAPIIRRSERPKAAPIEPTVARRVVYALTGATLDEHDRSLWPGYAFAQSIDGALGAVAAASGDGLTEIVVVAGRKGGDVEAEASRLRNALRTRGLESSARVIASEKRLLVA